MYDTNQLSASVPVPQNQTQREVSQLHSSANRLQERMITLEQRLLPITKTPPKENVKSTGEAQLLVPLAQEINAGRQVVDDIAERLEYILENIQI